MNWKFKYEKHLKQDRYDIWRMNRIFASFSPFLWKYRHAQIFLDKKNIYLIKVLLHLVL